MYRRQLELKLEFKRLLKEFFLKFIYVRFNIFEIQVSSVLQF